MKKRKIIKLFIIISIIGIMALAIHLYRNPPFPKVGDFNLEPFELIINDFPSDVVFGYTPNAKTAMRNAEKLWLDIYGWDEMVDEKPYEIYYDPNNEVWLVSGSMRPWYEFGGVAYAIIRKNDGKVFAVWHEK